uniref:Uncharacterized protein n=1 Tax=Trypanosoma congolense (strain IL3000) TaxID=1068625 RepID=G0UMI0_TRYCI|nr:conserved hypothetical protein [Trypanosoma congolense IL3000]
MAGLLGSVPAHEAISAGVCVRASPPPPVLPLNLNEASPQWVSQLSASPPHISERARAASSKEALGEVHHESSVTLCSSSQKSEGGPGAYRRAESREKCKNSTKKSPHRKTSLFSRIKAALSPPHRSSTPPPPPPHHDSHEPFDEDSLRDVMADMQLDDSDACNHHLGSNSGRGCRGGCRASVLCEPIQLFDDEWGSRSNAAHNDGEVCECKGDALLHLKGKIVKGLLGTEAKDRKRLQEESWTVMRDIWRTYAAMSRHVVLETVSPSDSA